MSSGPGEASVISLPEPGAHARGSGYGRVAVVTGAGRGIGAATVVALAAEGWSVLAVDSVADDPALPYPMSALPDLVAVTEFAVQHAGDPDRVRPFIADVRDLAAVQSAIAQAEEFWGGIDAAIAVAGVIAGGAPLWQVPVEHENAILGVDLMGVFNLARASITAMMRRPEPRSGRFLAVASAAATRGLPMLAAYCAAKAGVTGLVRALAVELADSGITANAVSPGSTDTAMLAETTRLYGLASNGEFAEQQPMRRLLDPAEVAAVLTFLASPASSGMTGAIVPVDAGLAL